ncbi:MAG TPA: 50S ribosomal protein L21 [Bryobacterales bacterium]|nr:50S ribosomal protein L21 [Bryobacterales bacterium]
MTRPVRPCYYKRLCDTYRSVEMFAIIETGGKQYRVSPGDQIRVETLPGELNSPVEFSRVLAVCKDGGELLAGDEVRAARVTGAITAHGRADKITVFKFKRKKQYKRKIGHRQNYTQVRINEVVL